MKRIASSIRTINNRLLTGLAAATVALLQVPAAAEDIDLFVQPPNGGGIPNVLILLDNTANWNTPFTNELAALATTIQDLPVNPDGSAKFRVGLMLFTETGSPNSNIDGGYVRAAVRDFTQANKDLFVDLVASLDRLGDVSNGGKAGLTMQEAYYYFDGQNPRSGNNKVKTDYTGNSGVSTASDAIYALPGNALPRRDRDGGIRSAPAYNSPISDASCGRNFIIYISNGAVQDNNSDTKTARDGLQAEGGDISQIPISPSGSASNVADEWARYMRWDSPHEIITYTLDVDKVTTGQGPGWSALLESTALVSEGHYFDVSSGNGGDEIVFALKDAFSRIQAVNSVFASVSLPVSVNPSGAFLNQIFIGMFRPDGLPFPRWAGNLKQYKLGITNGRLVTQDADSASAVNNTTGFITECARSFWTPLRTAGGDDNYWAFKPQGECLAWAGSENDNSPDGNIVEKGGHAFTLRAPTTGRAPFKTCSAASCTSLLDFSSTYVSQADLGAADTTEQGQLINWMLGMDIDDENNLNGTTQRRPSIHGDVVHSRPVAINMSTAADPDVSPEVVVFYGGNEGVLRAVNGNRATNIGSVGPGQEMWAFIAPEFFTSIKRLRDNTIPISYFGSTITTPTPQPKPYGIDGPITAYKNGTNVWLNAAMRRGGRTVYSFDVSTITNPTPGPTLKWRIGCPHLLDDTGCTPSFTGFTDIGQTWSSPTVLKAAGYGSGASPLLIMGGGYDTCEDGDPDTCPADPKGNRIYVLDANAGTHVGPEGTTPPPLITDRGVVSDVFVIKDQTTGLAKWAYAADLGGNIYRIGSGTGANAEIGSTHPSAWTMIKIASLGCPPIDPGCSPNRKFMMPLDVVEDPAGSGTYVILVGSGDREKPLMGFSAAYGVSNFFFKIVDRPTNTTWLSSETGCGGLICLTSLLLIDSDPTVPVDPNELLLHPKGWYLELNPHEQVVTSAITVFGTTTFSTHTPTVPAVGACSSNLGTARVYNIAFANAANPNGPLLARNEVIVGGGLPPSPVAGMVTLDTGETLPFLIGGNPDSPLQGMEPVPSGLAAQPKSLTYWYIHK